MSSRVQLSGHDLTNAPDILRTDVNGKYMARPELQDLACKSCGKMDERAALTRGIDFVAPFRTNKSIFCSFDGLLVGDQTIVSLLTNLFPSEFGFYPIPSTPGYHVLVATRSIAPVPGTAGYRWLKPCKVCKRYEQLLWSNEPPTIPNRLFVSIDLETRLGICQAWLIEKTSADALSSYYPPLKGLCLAPMEVNLTS